MQTRERAHRACSVFPFIKKKKKNLVDCGDCTLSGGGKQVRSVERLFTFLSLKTSFVSDRLTASTKGYNWF